MESSELGRPPNDNDDDDDVDDAVGYFNASGRGYLRASDLDYFNASDVSDDGNQIEEEDPIDHELVGISHQQQALAQVTAQASQFQSQRQIEAEYSSPAQHPPVTSDSAPQKMVISTDQKGRYRFVVSGSGSQEQGGTNSSKIKESPSLFRISKLNKSKAASVEENSGVGEVFSMPSEMPDRYDNTGKLLPINSEKQQELIPTAKENIDVRTNLIYLQRDYLEESDPNFPTQQEASLSTVPPPSSSTQREDSRPNIPSPQEASLSTVPSSSSTQREDSRPHDPSPQDTSLPTMPPPSSSTQRENSRLNGQVERETSDPKKRKGFTFPTRWNKKK